MRPAAALLCLLLLACSAPKTAPKAAAAAPVPAAPSVPAVPSGGGPAFPGLPAPAAAAPVVPARPFDESVLTGREFLLEAGARPAPALRDPVVGPLADDPAVVRAVEAFLKSAAAGTADPALLEPRWAAYLTAWAKKNGPAVGAGAVRTGGPLPEKDGVVLVPVVVRGEGRTARGWLALSRTDEGWLVSDAEVNPDTAAPTLFDPEQSGQLISSPSLR